MKALKAKRMKKSKYKPDAEPSTTIFRKGSVSQDDLVLSEPASVASENASHAKQHSVDSLGDFNEVYCLSTVPIDIISGSEKGDLFLLCVSNN